MNNFNQNLNNQQENQSQTNFQQNQQSNQQQSSWLMQIAGACLPVLLKQFTGQELMSSSPNANNAGMELALSQVLSAQQQILTIQQSLSERISNLESNLISLGNNASNQFTNLVQEVKGIKSVRLTHERKQIELNGNNYHSQQPQE